MFGLNSFATGQIGYGACHFQYAVVGACRQIHARHGGFQQLLSGLIDGTIFAQHFRRHLRIAIDAFVVAEARSLNAPRRDDTFANDGTRFGRCHFGEFIERHRHYFDVHVDAVEQRSADATQIFLNHSRRANAVAIRMIVVAARTGIHGRHQHKTCRIFDGKFSTRDTDFAVFERLAHHLQHLTLKFGQLVEKQHAVVRQRNFARLRISATAHQRHIGYGVMRIAERALRHERRFAVDFAGHGVYFGRFERFVQRQRRQDGRYAFGHHRFAGTRRAYHYNIVSAGSSHFDGALYIFLTFHIGKVEFERGRMRIKLITRIDNGRLQRFFMVEEIDHIGNVIDAQHIQIVDDSGFACILARHDKAFETVFARQNRNRQHAFYRFQCAIERQFAHNDILFDLVGSHHARCSQHANGQRQIVGGALFANVGRRHIDDHLFARNRNPIVLQRRHDAFVALFDGIIRQSHKKKFDALRNIDLYSY